MTTFKFVVYQEGKYFVSQCLNMDVSSFGDTIDEAVENLKDAVSLYLADDVSCHHPEYRPMLATNRFVRFCST